MPIHCTDGEISNTELSSWEVSLPPMCIALRQDQVRAVFQGKPLSRGIAILGLNRAQFDKLFRGKGQRKAAYNLLRFARRIQGEEARRVLAGASWHQLRAAAAYEGDDAQIRAAMVWTLGIRR